MKELEEQGLDPRFKGRKRKLLEWPKDVDKLHMVSEEVTEFDDSLNKLVADLFATIKKVHNAVALAAVQIGVHKRLFVTAIPNDDDTIKYGIYINPEIKYKDARYPYRYDEGCVSIPGYHEYGKRPASISMTWQDLYGDKHTEHFTNFEAFAIQHEYDHLEGKLFIDNASSLKKKRIRDTIKKHKRTVVA